MPSMATTLSVQETHRDVPVRFTAEEFLRMGDLGLFDDRKVELVDGEIIELGWPGFPHGMLQMRLGFLLQTALGGTGMIVTGETGMLMAGNRVRAVDCAVVRRPPATNLLAPSDVILAIEISDTTLGRDLVAKALDYGQAGIPHYWVLDVNARVTHAMTAPGPFGYSRREAIGFDDTLAVPGSDAKITLAG